MNCLLFDSRLNFCHYFSSFCPVYTQAPAPLRAKSPGAFLSPMFSGTDRDFLFQFLKMLIKRPAAGLFPLCLLFHNILVNPPGRSP